MTGKKRLKVFIISEGGSGIGFGHITRCVSVYEAFAAQGISARLIINCRGEKGDLCRKVERCLCFDWLKYRDRLSGYVRGADIAIMDSYLAPLDFYKMISKSAKTPVYFDDNMRLDYPGGVIINGAVYADRLRYRRKKGTICLLGPRYIPLRKEFLNIRKKSIGKQIRSVMVTFGGGDYRNMTPKVMRILAGSYPSFIKNVVIGKGFKNVEEVQMHADVGTNLIYYPDAAGMVKIMLRSDMAISGGGQTLYELALAGVPTVAVMVADNQSNNITGLVRGGAIGYAGKWNSRILERKIKRFIHDMNGSEARKGISQAGKRIVDGLGAARIAKRLINL